MPTASIDLECPPGADRPSGDITHQLRSWQRGDGRALDLLTPQILQELRRMARSVLGGARDRTLGVTALVHEGYLRLAHRSGVQWSCRGEVFAYMATTMRRIVLNHVRDGQAAKRGGGAVVLSLDRATDTSSAVDAALAAPSREQLLDLDAALDDLARLDARQARLVELRYFLGLSVEETAAVLSISDRTVKREWRSARLWLKQRLGT